MMSSASPSGSITGGLIATQPNAPRPSPAIFSGDKGQTSVTFPRLIGEVEVDGGYSPPRSTVVAKLVVSAASMEIAFSVIAAAPSDAATALRFCQRVGTRDRSTESISAIVG